ncbi:hypothetical protein CLV59_109322 [Chitinophaga dinghuensis]|uniref:Uncharacterized protein n=1 Tax=Chitinophaga dinghuensis TaxID=1539050 RepID=A0A327VQP1_9BACT|nr:hypothetical protein [Chitinophaga dinghuensis]RAJ75707.1 hypothetical protein CLV59_109322 [Chitinophaga dinghuensis]
MKSYFCTNRVLAWTFSGLAVAALFFACKKDAGTKNPDEASNQNDNKIMLAATHQGQVDVYYADVFSEVNEAAKQQGIQTVARQSNGDGALQATNSCPSWGIDNVGPGWPKTVTINFGTSCANPLTGRVRSGVITAVYSGLLFVAGSTVTVTFDNYKVNGLPVTGKIIYTVNSYSTDAKGGISFTQRIIDGGIKLNDSVNIVYNHTKTVTQTAGGATPFNPGDDEFDTNGAGNMDYKDAAGKTTATVALSTPIPLHTAWSCQYITKGQLKAVLNNLSAVIDYGNGTCDNIATITVGDKSKQITL